MIDPFRLILHYSTAATGLGEAVIRELSILTHYLCNESARGGVWGVLIEPKNNNNHPIKTVDISLFLLESVIAYSYYKVRTDDRGTGLGFIWTSAMLVIGSLEQQPDTPLMISNNHTGIWVKRPLWGHGDPEFVYFKWDKHVQGHYWLR